MTFLILKNINKLINNIILYINKLIININKINFYLIFNYILLIIDLNIKITKLSKMNLINN